MKSAAFFLLVFSACLRGQAPAQTSTQAPAAAESAEAPPAGSKANVSQTPDANPDAAKVEPARKPPTDPGEFVIGPEDVLLLRVLHETELSGTQEVRPDGYISIAMIGEVKASGMTLGQLSDTIHDRLLKLMRDPQVDVQLVRVNSRKFTLQGEVTRPGTYTFATPPTVLEALVNGMGFRDFANTKKIYILRHGKKIPFNYKQVSRGKHMEQNIPIQNGDQIFVP